MTDLSPLAVSTLVKKLRVAVLVDGENVSADYAGKIITKSLTVGELQVRRVYGNVANLKKWPAAPGFRMIHSGTGKNATDILLAVEAMSLALTHQIDALVIVSSDRDFTHLATNLREAGHLVIGMGESKAPAAFRKACVRFEVLPELVMERSPILPAAKPPEVKPDQPVDLDTLIRGLIHATGKDRVIGVAQLGTALKQHHQKVAKDFGARTWSGYLRLRPDLYAMDANGGNPCVRLKHT